MNDDLSQPACAWCGDPIMGRGAKKFCSPRCASAFGGRIASNRSPWTGELRQYVHDNYGTIPTSQMAEHCGPQFNKNMVIGLAYRMGLSKGDEVYKPILSDRDFVGCRYIEGNPLPLTPGMYCCAPVVEGTSYCSHHFLITRKPITEVSLAQIEAAAESVVRKAA